MKFVKWIWRLVVVGLIYISLSLTLTSPVELKVDSTAGLVKSSINKVVDQANNSDLQMGVSFLQDSGIEDTLLSQLPKDIELKTSYQGLNQLSTNYLANDKLTDADLNLKNDTQQEQVFNQVILQLVNEQLRQNSDSVKQAAEIYHLIYFLLIGLYILAMALALFGKKVALIPLLIAAIGSYGVLSYAAQIATSSLHESVYSGINVSLSSGLTQALITAIIAAVGCLFIKIKQKRE
ncbi:hypothetical protein A3Q05_08835 [Lactobacillus johnsonii]|uniref:Uncharacterized protein n=1 Tax=Lactobacillus johnsonii (strain FI9785) TaxID=633699 RepID=D0R506_LACJF|nr:hypothetical protein [Lactobacillus johnsonii]NME19717.1 hypothetical protein [Lactobacillus johnsonii]OUP17415.1 hypothetical protein B5F30_01235 [Lactobacillus johnsonii]PAB53723.1 hypothetical protein A3Q05_08835 [Lactobacillus johnsonii]PEG68372.1 hypothetical protein A3Q23_00515 [Lactobacillus johnsonii]PEG69675.1 hypothetical protein A3Q04_02685 [Lactobacillus johnsonii]